MSKQGFRIELLANRIYYTVFSALISITAWAEDVVQAKVVAVIDGNTIEILTTQSETYEVIFFGIDCPEIEQEFGEKAKRFLEKLILDKNVTVQFQGKDRWGNRLAVVWIEGEVDPRVELLQQGLAWTAERSPIMELETVREQAKEKGKGLWKEENPTPPWIFRRQQTMLQPKSS